MEFRLFGAEEKEEYRSDILEMMREADRDFVPPLSARTSSVQKDLSSAVSCENGIELYYEEMNRQEILGAFEGDLLLGFVSFRKNYSNDVIGEDTFPNVYMSTLILKSLAKGKGLTVKLYDHLFHVLYPECSVYTRTWSTNAPHARILDKFSFEEIKRLVDDRGPGIDTVYFRKWRRE